MRYPNHFAAAFLAILSFAPSDFGATQAWSQASSESGSDLGELTYEFDGWKLYRRRESSKILVTEREIHASKRTGEDTVRTFLPPDNEMTDGNAALWYLQAGGFFEQQASSEWLHRFRNEEHSKMQADEDYYAAPYRWQSVFPSELDLDNVNEYLDRFQFQERLLDRAHHCRKFDMQRSVRKIERPADLPLPEIQSMRHSILHPQSIRIRAAIAEGRVDDAILGIGRCLHFGHHLSQDTFLPTTLVGVLAVDWSFRDALHLITDPSCPNLYDAFSNLPSPLIDQSNAIEFHRNALFYQVPALRDFRKKGFPSLKAGILVDQAAPYFDDCDLKNAYERGGRASVALYAADASPEADRYLAQYGGYTSSELNAQPVHARFFKAIVSLYDQIQTQRLRNTELTDDASRDRLDSEQRLKQSFPRLHDCIAWILHDDQYSITVPQRRVIQRIALLRAIEAIRDHAARHQRLPKTLAELQLPVPPDPVTGKPISYSPQGESAVLTTADNGAEEMRLVLTLASTGDGNITSDATETSSPLTHPLIQYSVPNSVPDDPFSESEWWASIPKISRDRFFALLREPIRPLESQEEPSSNLNPLLKMDPVGGFSTVDPTEVQNNGDLEDARDWAGTDSISAILVMPKRARLALDESVGDNDTNTLSKIAAQIRWAGIKLDLSKPSLDVVCHCVSQGAAEFVGQHLDEVAEALIQKLAGLPAPDSLSQSLQGLTVSIDEERLSYRWSAFDQDQGALAVVVSAFSDLIRRRNDSLRSNRMQKIILALHNHHSAYRAIPPFRTDSKDNVNTELSWRVHLLPFTQDPKNIDLYRRFKLDEPWDSPSNKPLVKEMPDLFMPIAHNPEAVNLGPGLTTFLSPQGPNCAMGSTGAKAFGEVKDGLAHTVFLVETDSSLAVPWTAPDDFQYELKHPTDGMFAEDEKVVVAFGDGVVMKLSIEQPEGAWNALFTCGGEEDLRPFWKNVQQADSAEE